MTMGNGLQFYKMGPRPAVGKVRQQKTPVAEKGWGVGNERSGWFSLSLPIETPPLGLGPEPVKVEKLGPRLK